MKALVILTMIVIGGAAHAEFVNGGSIVAGDASKGIIQITGNAAIALYEGMSGVAPQRIDSPQNNGYMKAGSRYLCTRLEQNGAWETTCTFQVTSFENALIGDL